MAAIVSLVEQAETWRLEHKRAARWLDAAYAACRQHTLLDALKALGGDDSKWRKPNGVFWR